jgi:hypothetical protein
MSASLPRRAGRGPPALRIHAGVRGIVPRPGPHCRPLDPASLSLFRGKRLARTPTVNTESFIRFCALHDNPYQEILL